MGLFTLGTVLLSPVGSAAAAGTWSTQTSGTANPLDGVSFVDAAHGWAVGASGTIVATTDGGASWSTQTSGTANALAGVSFVDAAHGWAVGLGGTILSTTDGGATWSPQASGTANNLCGVSFVDAAHGWAVGASGTILATTDGGGTWSPQASGTANTLAGVSFVDAAHGWAAGGAGTIVATTDGGATWSPQASGTANNLWGVSFVDAAHGWAVGNLGTIVTYADASPLIHVYVRGANGDLTEYVDNNIGNGHPWNAYDLSVGAPGGGQISGTPSVVHDPADGLIHIYVRAANGQLVEYVDDNANGHLWNAYGLSVGAPGGGPVAGNPSAFYDRGDGLIHIYVQAAGGQLVEYVNNDIGGGHPWNAYGLSVGAPGGGPVAGVPSAFYDTADTLIHIYVQAAGGQLVEYVNNDIGGGHPWNAYGLSVGAPGGGAVGGDPEATT
ncbi:MAG TPA: YCF48-related protein [Acidimicrobiales bacterium]|nr:YCF48-related protein [Acidimicrobiales bacterium]